jgi:type IV pilus assembly protein PilE
MKTREIGFTLIEVMIVVVVIALLVAVAYPSYQEHVRKGNRAEGKAALLKAAQIQERFFSDRGRYVDIVDLRAAFGANAGQPIYSGEDPNNVGGKYTITVVLGAGNTSYTVTATPNGNADSTAGGCGNLTLTSTGVRGRSGDKPMSQCW